jgi:hypothetical protein
VTKGFTLDAQAYSPPFFRYQRKTAERYSLSREGLRAIPLSSHRGGPCTNSGSQGSLPSH